MIKLAEVQHVFTFVELDEETHDVIRTIGPVRTDPVSAVEWARLFQTDHSSMILARAIEQLEGAIPLTTSDNEAAG